MLYIYIKDSTHSKSKASHLSNIWNDKTNYEINDAHCAIHITNTINIEQYDLWYDYVIESHNGLYKK